MHEIHLQKQNSRELQDWQKVEDRFLVFSAVSLVAFIERKIALAALY